MKIKEIKIDLAEMKEASFRLTRRCNNNCLHCCINLPIDENINELSVKNWEDIIDQLVANDFRYLSFTGGEITIYSGFKEVYLYAKRKGMILTLLTNATYFDDEICNMLIKFPPYKIIVTIYGINDKTYAVVTGNKKGWTEFSKNIDFLSKLQKEKDVILEFTSIFTKDTIKFYKKIDELGKKYTGKLPEYTKSLFSRLDGDIRKNKMIDAKKINKKDLKIFATDFDKYKDFCQGINTNNQSDIYDGLFACQFGKREYINFFEDGTMTACNLIVDEKYTIKLTDSELKNFDYRINREKLETKISPLYKLKINKKCGNCTLRKFCLSCPAKNLIEKIPIDGYNKETCLKEL